MPILPWLCRERDMRTLSNCLRTPRPMTYVGLSGFGIEISSSEGLE
jgi:3,4-dihydroxy 2-butanone 4-phosphate synthase / GTP cyclohydrolase II